MISPKAAPSVHIDDLAWCGPRLPQCPCLTALLAIFRRYCAAFLRLNVLIPNGPHGSYNLYDARATAIANGKSGRLHGCSQPVRRMLHLARHAATARYRARGARWRKRRATAARAPRAQGAHGLRRCHRAHRVRSAPMEARARERCNLDAADVHATALKRPWRCAISCSASLLLFPSLVRIGPLRASAIQIRDEHAQCVYVARSGRQAVPRDYVA